MKRISMLLLVVLVVASVALADEAPISGTVKSVDPAANTLTLEVAGRGKTREVIIHVKPGARIVRFARSMDPSKASFVEQEVPLAAIKPGWVVSATTKHEGDREVADSVKIVFER